MSMDRVAPEKAGTRKPYTAPALRVLGTFQALTQTRTCAKGYNDGTGVGCSKSFKKS
jgi:hypothetical protein